MPGGRGRLYPPQRQRRALVITVAAPFPNADSPRLPVDNDVLVVDKQWACFFNGRAGGRAQAVFGTKEEARQFAERHARSITPSRMSLKWDETNESTTLRTQLGDYAIVRIGTANSRRRRARRSNPLVVTNVRSFSSTTRNLLVAVTECFRLSPKGRRVPTGGC